LRELSFDVAQKLRVSVHQVLEQAHEVVLVTVRKILQRSTEAQRITLAVGIGDATDESEVDAITSQIVVREESLDGRLLHLASGHQPTNGLHKVVAVTINPVSSRENNTGLG
jgi:hypothetical protein